jgi:hypothetical protein
VRARSLPYLDAVLKEALRLYPPAPTIIRQATRAMDLGGRRVSPGQWLAVAAYSMHRNAAYWQARPRPDPPQQPGAVPARACLSPRAVWPSACRGLCHRLWAMLAYGLPRDPHEF